VFADPSCGFRLSEIVDQLQSALNAILPRFEAVDASVDAGQPFLDGGHANLQVADVVTHWFDDFEHPGEVFTKEGQNISFGHDGLLI